MGSSPRDPSRRTRGAPVRSPRRRARRGAALLVTAALLLGASAAHAEPNAAERETARGLMARGRDLRTKGDLVHALEAFKSADAIMHVPTTGFEVADTQASLGLLVEARDTALGVARSPSRPDDPAPFVSAREKAQKLSDALEGRIPTISISVTPSAGDAEIRVDGTALPAGAASIPYRLDPGRHTIDAKSGERTASATVDVAEGGTKKVVLDLDAATARPAGTGPAHEDRPVEASTRGVSAPRLLMYVGFGVGAAGLAVGTVTGLMALNRTASLKDQCPNDACPPNVYDQSSFQDDKSSAATLGNVSTIGFIVGGVGVAAGVTGLVLEMRGDHEPARPAVGASVHPWFGPTSAGLRGTF